MKASLYDHLRRLPEVWAESPVFFVTVCVENRLQILAQDRVAGILVDEWTSAPQRHGWGVGRYVIMPDHVHLFCAPFVDPRSLPRSTVAAGADRGSSNTSSPNDPPRSPRAATAHASDSGCDLSRFVGAWKEWTCKRINNALNRTGQLWQREFFDHLLRSNESYEEKWHYVRENPVRAGLVKQAEEWKFQGELEPLMI